MGNSEKGFNLGAGIFSFGQRYGSIFLNFGTFYFLVRLYPKTVFATWALFSAIVAVVEVARSGLIRNAKIRFINYEESDLNLINTASLFLNILFSILTCIVLYFLGPLLAVMWEMPEMTAMLNFYMITIVIMTFNSQYEYLLFAHKKFQGAFAGTTIRYGILFLFVLTFYATDYKPSLVNLVNIQSFASLISTVILFFYARPYFDFSRIISKEWVFNLLNFGKYTFGTNVSAMLNRYIDQSMIGAMISPAAVAGYNTAIRVSTLIEAPSLAIASIVFPETAKKIRTEGKEAVKEVYEKSAAALFAITLPAVLFTLIFPKFIILIIAGKEYLDSVVILQITVLYSLFLPFARQFGTIFDSIGRPKLNFFFVVLNTALNLTLNYVFIKAFGLYGAAYGSLASYSIVFIMNQIVLYKVLNISTVRTLVNTFYVYKKLLVTTKSILVKYV